MFNFKKNHKMVVGNDSNGENNLRNNQHDFLNTNNQNGIDNHFDTFTMNKNNNYHQNQNNLYGFDHLSRNKIQEILYQNLGYCNEFILDDLHSKSILNNWNETDVHKWIIENKDHFNTNDNFFLYNDYFSKNNSNFNEYQNYYNNNWNSPNYSQNSNLIHRIDELNKKIDNLEKIFKNTIIEENYRKLIIENQTEILKNYFNDRFSNTRTQIQPINNKFNEFSDFDSNFQNYSNQYQNNDYDSLNSFNNYGNLNKNTFNNNEFFNSLIKDNYNYEPKTNIDDSLNFKITDIDKFNTSHFNEEKKGSSSNTTTNNHYDYTKDNNLNKKWDNFIETIDKKESIEKDLQTPVKESNYNTKKEVDVFENASAKNFVSNDELGNQIELLTKTSNLKVEPDPIVNKLDLFNNSSLSTNDEQKPKINNDSNVVTEKINFTETATTQQESTFPSSNEDDEIHIEINNIVDDQSKNIENSSLKENNLNNSENKNYNSLIGNENEINLLNIERQKLENERKELEREKSLLEDTKRKDLENEALKLGNLKISDLTSNTVWELDDIIKELNQLNIIDDEIKDVIDLKEKFKKI